MLSTMQKNLLTELVNTYIGQAAISLSEMSKKRMTLSVPKAELFSVKDIKSTVHQVLNAFCNGHIVSSSIKFENHFEGKAFLIFPINQAKFLTNVYLDEDLNSAKSNNSKYLIDTDFDILKEVGNVILNAIIGGLSSILEVKLEYSLTEIEVVSIANSEQQVLFENNVHLLILQTDFSLDKTLVNGVILVALSMDSVSLLTNKIDEILEVKDGYAYL